MLRLEQKQEEGRGGILLIVWRGEVLPKISKSVCCNICIWGLARYCVHATATWDQFWNIIKNVWNYWDGVFWVSPWLIESRSYKNQVWNITHHTSHITHHILHRILLVLQNISEHNSGDLPQFIKTDPVEFWWIFFDRNHHIDNTNTYVRSKICHTNPFTVKQGTLWKIRFSLKIFKK